MSLTQLDRLPAELLRSIFSHFAEPQVKDLQTLEYWKPCRDSPWKQSRATLQRLRLVCRRFCDAASPLLFSYLSISVEKESVAAAEAISKSPRLAPCIRGVIVHMGLYNMGIAESLEQHCMRVVGELHDFNRRQQDTIGMSGAVEDREMVLLQSGVRAMTENLISISRAWSGKGAVVREERDRVIHGQGATDTESLREERRLLYPIDFPYQDTLAAGHEAYAQRMRRQRQYLNSGAFAKDLVACLVRLPHLDTVEMDARRAAPMDLQDVLEGGNPTALRRYIEYGHEGPWKAPDSFRDVHLASIKTLLPKRLYDAGIRLCTLSLGVFPTTLPLSDYCTGESHRLPDQDTAMKDLAKAFETLTSVTINIYFETNEYWREFGNQYITAVLSSPDLQEVEMFAPLPQTVSGAAAMETTAYRAGHILATRSPTRLRRLHLTGLMMPEAALGDILTGCSDIRLGSVYLQDGRWANIVDKVAAARASEGLLGQRRTVQLRRLKGGEMGRILLTDNVSLEETKKNEQLGYGGTEPIILLMAEEYLRGDARVQKNPFIEHKKQASYFKVRNNAEAFLFAHITPGTAIVDR